MEIMSIIMQWIVNPILWFFILLILVAGIFISLLIRKNKRLIYPVIEVVDLGNGKACLNNLMAGYYGKKLHLKGLWWTGEEILRVKSGEIIRDLSSTDFKEIDNKRGIVVVRDMFDSRILVPVSKIEIKGKELLIEIAPSSYVEACVDSFKDAVEETTDFKDKLLSYGVMALLIIFSLMAIIFIIQYVKGSQKEAGELLLQAGSKGAEACRNLCSDFASSIKSTTAP